MKTILIVDDMKLNRTILSRVFCDTYKILEAENGQQALELIQHHPTISAIFLDLIMPVMDGLSVLRELNQSGIIHSFPVFIITASDNEKILMEAYNLGAVDIISKPFMIPFLKYRVNNTVELYQYQNDLQSIINEQVQKIKHINQQMVETLAAIIEFRNGETGDHVKRIYGLTSVIMKKVVQMFPEYYLPDVEIEKIAQASILHDVGKIVVPDYILNKPEKLTPEEYEIMKLHTVKGCELLSQIPDVIDKDLYDYSYDICRHHHERYDGKGYPDGLAGNDITIWSQAVAVADVYDALTAERVYKAAIPHETAVKMIFDGECGAFNPKILQAFGETILYGGTYEYKK